MVKLFSVFASAAMAFTAVIFVFAPEVPYSGPNTEILVISKSCAPCVAAIRIVTKLQNEGYDVVIINIKGTPPERALARMFKVKITPTLVVRERDEPPKKVVGLQTEKRYKELISQ